MNYLLLIYNNEAETMALGETTLKKMLGEYTDFTKSIVQAGNFKAADRLRPVSSASTVRVRNGKTAVTDGPFAETREQLGGYYLVDAKKTLMKPPPSQRASPAPSTAASKCAPFGRLSSISPSMR